nr:uncharacterized protein LOC109170758 isoform X2 [Ipomoea trifida]
MTRRSRSKNRQNKVSPGASAVEPKAWSATLENGVDPGLGTSSGSTTKSLGRTSSSTEVSRVAWTSFCIARRPLVKAQVPYVYIRSSPTGVLDIAARTASAVLSPRQTCLASRMGSTKSRSLNSARSRSAFSVSSDVFNLDSSSLILWSRFTKAFLSGATSFQWMSSPSFAIWTKLNELGDRRRCADLDQQGGRGLVPVLQEHVDDQRRGARAIPRRALDRRGLFGLFILFFFVALGCPGGVSLAGRAGEAGSSEREPSGYCGLSALIPGLWGIALLGPQADLGSWGGRTGGHQEASHRCQIKDYVSIRNSSKTGWLSILGPTVRVVNNFPTYYMLANEYIVQGKPKEEIRARFLQPVLDIKNIDYKEVAKSRVDHLKVILAEKYLDLAESIWPFYCRAIRTLSRVLDLTKF